MTTYEWLIGDESSSDTLSTEDSRGLMIWDLYGSTNTLEYSINIDWDNDGDLDGSNEAEYMLRWACDRGRQRLIGSPGSGFEPYRVGRLTVELDNHDGRFNPWNTDSPLYGNLEPGKLMEMKVAIHDSTSATGYTTYSVFTGYTTGMTQHGWNNTVTLECEDGLGMLENKKFDMFMSPFTENVTGALTEFADTIDYPYGTDFSTDDNSTDYIGLMAYSDDESALFHFEQLCSATLGTIACEKDGTLAYHSIYESDSSILTLTDSNTIRYPEFPNPWEYQRNNVKIKGNKLGYYPDGSYLCFIGHKELTIDPSVSETFWLPYFAIGQDEESVDVIDSFYDNIFATIYFDTASITSAVSYISESTSSSDAVPSSNYSLDITPFLWNAKIEVTNSSTSTIFITNIDFNAGAYRWMDGDVTADYEKYQVGSTSYNWNLLDFNIDSRYNHVTFNNNDDNMVYTSFTAAQRARIEKLGNLIYNYVSTEHVFPILQMEGRYDYQFLLDVEKKVTYASALLGISDDYRICGLSHQSLSTPQSVLTTIYLYPVIPSST